MGSFLRLSIGLMSLLAVVPATATTTGTATSSGNALVAGYQEGFFMGTTDDSSRLRVRSLLQARFTFEGADADVARNAMGFSVPRAQIELVGHFLTKALTFQVRTDFALGFTFLRDAWIDYAFVPGCLALRGGQFRKAFSRQELLSDWQLAFTERSITNAFFGGGRDVGVQLHNGLEKAPPVEWAVGVFDGTTDRPQITGGVTTNSVTKAMSLERVVITNIPKLMQPTLIGHLGFNYGNVKIGTEMDVDGGLPRFGVGVSVLEGIAIDRAQVGITTFDGYGLLKAWGLDVNAEVYLRLQQRDGGTSTTSTFDQRYRAVGAHLEAGYLIAGLVHPALRYDAIRIDGAANDRQEISGAVTVLLFQQNVAWQIDGSVLLDEAQSSGRPTYRCRTQLTLSL